VSRANLTLLTVVGLAYWFFGNLYESVVFSPNWVIDTPAQIGRLNDFFVNTSPTTYFVPLLIVTDAVFLGLWIRDRRRYARAAVLMLVLNIVNAGIVTGVAIPLFAEGTAAYAWTWNALNVVRMLLTAAAAYTLFQVYRELDRSRPDSSPR